MNAKRMNRREFLKRSAECTALAAVGAASPAFLQTTALAAQAPDIVVADGLPGPATYAAVKALGGMKRFVKPDAKVVIKPNMSFANPPERATTTHPDVIKALASMCLDAGASSVLVLDNTLRPAEMCLDRSGLKEACEFSPKARAEVLDVGKFYQKVNVPKGVDLKSTKIMKRVLEADVLIAAPVAKSHSDTGVSLSMKGMMGLILNRREMHWNMDLNTAIVDLCTVLPTALSVVDASRILSSGGPGGPGDVITLNKIIASTDIVAADAMAVELGTWYGKKFKASQVKHILLAHQRGLGNMNVSEMAVKKVTG
jgi:uncharacterized protein (DUF362 family)